LPIGPISLRVISFPVLGPTV